MGSAITSLATLPAVTPAAKRLGINFAEESRDVAGYFFRLVEHHEVPRVFDTDEPPAADVPRQPLAVFHGLEHVVFAPKNEC